MLRMTWSMAHSQRLGRWHAHVQNNDDDDDDDNNKNNNNNNNNNHNNSCIAPACW